MDYSKELTSKKIIYIYLYSKFHCDNLIDAAKVTTLSSMCSYGQWLKILGTHPCICLPRFFSFSLSYSRFLELLHVRLRSNEVWFCLLHCCDIHVLICGDDEHVYI
jgi:hypothetical protein